MGQAAEQAQEKIQPAVGQAKEKTQELRARAGGRVRQEVDTRSTQAADQAQTLADAVRTTGEQLRGEGKEQPAKLAEQGAERTERLAQYLRESDADRIIRDAEEFGRRRPWAVATIGLALGLVAARFLKAGGGGQEEQGGAQPEPAELPVAAGGVATPAG